MYIKTESMNKTDLKEKWGTIASKLSYAFQPIVNIYTGECYGVEALLRDYKKAGFEEILDVFNEAYRDRMLFHLDIQLKEKALNLFTQIPFFKNIRLFYNIDNRTLIMPDYSRSKISEVFNRYSISPGSFCFEISEKHDFKTLILHDINGFKDINSLLKNHKNHSFRIAIDDFGAGFSGLELLYHSEPDFIKLDRFFISNINSDARKKLFVESTVKMAHVLGIIVIAEGVESAEELYACKSLGCDYIQGYFVEKPTLDIHSIKNKYTLISDLNHMEQRNASSDINIIRNQIQKNDTIPLYNNNGKYIKMDIVLESFRHSKTNFLPVVNNNDEPVGIIREKDLKDYVYSPYGKDLLKNRSSENITQFITKIPIADIRISAERILETFTVFPDADGIVLTDNGKYVGLLNASSLLKVLNEKNISEARDQNPLTKLPGNNLINKYISETVESEESHVFIYFDFDNFKPFNDIYGFRQGDRAILMFSDILREYYNKYKIFIGHIGGDDFFIGFKQNSVQYDAESFISSITARFKSDVKSIYLPEDQKKGYISATDRNGHNRRFPLLEVSAGGLIIPSYATYIETEKIFTCLAEMKKIAKKSVNKVNIKSYDLC